MSHTKMFRSEASSDYELTPIDPALANADPFAVPESTPSSTHHYDNSPTSTTNAGWMGLNFDFLRSKHSDSPLASVHSPSIAHHGGDMDEENGRLIPNSLHSHGAAAARALSSLTQTLSHWIAVAQASEFYATCRNAASNRLTSLSSHLPVGVKFSRFLSVAVLLIVVSILSMIVLSSSSSSSDAASAQHSHQHHTQTPMVLSTKTTEESVSDFSDGETTESNEESIPTPIEEDAPDSEIPPPAPAPLAEETIGTDEPAAAAAESPPPTSKPQAHVAPSSSQLVTRSQKQKKSQHQDPRYLYLRYDSPQGVNMFDCNQFPQPEHKVLQEWHYLNADGSRPAFYQQQIRHQSNAFISCPASRPRIVILRGKFGRIFGTDQKTGEPVSFPYSWGGEFTEFEFSTGLREKCQGVRFCCINRAEWHFAASEIGLVSWYCEEGTVKQEGENVQHGSLVIYQSEMTVLANLTGTDSYAAAATGTPRVEAAHPLPPLVPKNPRCTLSLHQSVHMYFGGQGAGLIHQISSLTSAIGMAAISKCDVNSEGFYPDFDLLHPVPLGLVIDLNHWNRHFELQNFDVKVIDKVMDTHLYPFTTFPHGPPCVGISLNDMRSPPKELLDKRPFKDFRSGQQPHQYIMGHMFPFWMFDDTTHLTHLRNVVVGDIQFTPPFRKAAAEIIKGLHLTPGEFIVIHFRLEADTKEFAARKGLSEVRWRENVFSKIVLALQERKVPDNAQIYLSTGLNADDGYVQRFKNIFPNAVTKDMLLQECKSTAAPSEEQQRAAASATLRASRWDIKMNPALHALSQIPWTSRTDECGLIRGDEFENREYWALLDWIVARESKLFIGSQASMYSQMIDKLITFHPRQWWDTGSMQSTFFLKDD